MAIKELVSKFKDNISKLPPSKVKATGKKCDETACPYYERVEVPYSGYRDAEVVVVGESPGKMEVFRGQPFVGPSGQILDALLNSIGLSRPGDVYVTNSCRCMISKDQDSTKTQNEALAFCRGKLVKAITTIKPKVVIALGAVALQQLLKKKQITKNRGRFFFSEEFDCYIFVTVHPAFILRGASQNFWLKPASERTMLENLMFEDFKLVKSFLKTGKTPELNTDNYVEGTADDLQQFAQSKVVAFDFETTGLDLFDPDIRVLCVSMCSEPGQSKVFFCDPVQGFHPLVKTILTDPEITKVVANRPFDERVCKQKLGFTVKGPVHDVFTMAHLLDENYRSYNLESLAEIYTPLKGIKTLAEGMRGNLGDLEKDKLINYSGVDADATLRVYRALSAKLKADPILLNYYLKFTHRIQNMLADTFYNGTPVDVEQLAADEKELTEIRDELHDQALRMIPRAIRLDPKNVKKQKLSRTALVREYLFTHPKGKGLRPKPKYITPKTQLAQISEKHLKQFPNVPFIKVYLRMCKASKIIGTYLKKYWGDIRSDGRVYPSTLLYRIVTGRAVMKEPVIQTIPKRSEFAKYAKRCFVAPEGWLMGARDLAQSEMRIAAWIANDEVMLDTFRRGIDIYKKTASLVLDGKPIEEISDEERQKAKPVALGFLFEMSAKGFIVYAKDNYGQEFTEEQGLAFQQAYYAYPTGFYKLPEYYRKQKATASRQGFVRTPLGRVRRLPDAQSSDKGLRSAAFRQAINTPIQSFSSDLAFISQYLFWKEIAKRGWRKYVKPTWMIHDAIMFLAREDYFAQAMALLKECMEVRSIEYIEKNFGVTVGYPIGSDGEGGKSWASMVKWDDEKGAFKEKKVA